LEPSFSTKSLLLSDKKGIFLFRYINSLITDKDVPIHTTISIYVISSDFSLFSYSDHAPYLFFCTQMTPGYGALKIKQRLFVSMSWLRWNFMLG